MNKLTYNHYKHNQVRCCELTVKGCQKMGWHKRQQTKSNDPENPATLADMIHEGLSVFCWCNRCGHNSTVDPVPLADVLGSFFPVPELGGRMRCSLCQTRDITTRPAWPNHGGGQIARHS